MLQAVVAFTLFCIVLGTSVIIVIRKMKYEWWYFPHLLTYAAVLLAYGHQMQLGEDLQKNVFAAYWAFIYATVLVLVGWNRFLKPLLQYGRQKFAIDEVRPENGNVLSIYIKGEAIEKL